MTDLERAVFEAAVNAADTYVAFDRTRYQCTPERWMLKDKCIEVGWALIHAVDAWRRESDK